MIKSIYDNQNDILEAIQTLHCPTGFECDITFGNGSFWKEILRPKFCFDIEPLYAGVVKANSIKLPLEDNILNNMVFDPPFLTYIKSGREGNGNMVMSKRFGGYWTYDELGEHYIATLMEAKRILKKKGVLIFKCQDIIHNHKMHCTHINVVLWAGQMGFRLKDLFILTAKHRMPVRAAAHGKQIQKHARIFHSYFLVLEKV